VGAAAGVAAQVVVVVVVIRGMVVAEAPGKVVRLESVGHIRLVLPGRVKAT
jgi:hypothetical protein